MKDVQKLRMPAEWEQHAATWIAWPHADYDFPMKVEAVQWVYTEIVRCLIPGERVEILCNTEAVRDTAMEQFRRSGIAGNYRFHVRPHDRGWLRDSMPTGVIDANGLRKWVQWKFTAWARFDNYSSDALVPEYVSSVTKRDLIPAYRPGTTIPLVLEGGAIETDGDGTLIVTEECLLSDVQERNRGLSREEYEEAFRTYLGIEKVLWLGAGIEGDTTHGHIDDTARFVAPGVVALAVERNSKDPNYAPTMDNLERVQKATDARGRSLQIVELPIPHRFEYDETRLPATYANFYIGNKVVLVPTFNDPLDAEVLIKLRPFFPDRQIIGIHAVDLVVGEGTLHCLSQQEPN